MIHIQTVSLYTTLLCGYIYIYIYIYIRILCAVLNKSWRQHSTKKQLYGHLPPIMKTIQIRRARYVRHSWRSKGELISNVLLWTSSHGRARLGWPARSYLKQLCTNWGCNTKDLQREMDDRDAKQERVREIRANGIPWWYIYIYIYIYKQKLALN